MSRGRDKGHIAFIGHFDLINRKRVEVDGSLRPFIGSSRSFRVPHDKRSSWNRHHGDRVKLFGGRWRRNDRRYRDSTGYGHHPNNSAPASSSSP